MNKFKKAQTATEYMIILAVIIIIALIVVGVMGGIPGLGGTTRGRAASAYWQSADIGIPAFASKVAGSYDTMKIRNNMRDSITITQITIDTLSVNTTDAVYAPGETKTITIENLTACVAAGDSFTYDVSIAYTNDETAASYTFTGDGNKIEGKCAA